MTNARIGSAGRLRYIAELDGLRAVAVVLVVLFHSDGAFTGGFVGVDLFFVLSAFLITSILTTERQEVGAIDLRRFYWRRFLRLIPPLLLMLCAYLAAAPVVWPGYPHGRDAALAATYVSNYTFLFWQAPLYLQHTWSLAVEEQFYLIWPLLLVPLLKARNPLLWLIVAFFTLTAWRMSFTSWVEYYYRFDTRATGLLLGAMLFFALPSLKPSPVWAWTGVALLFIIAFTGQIHQAALYIPFAEVAAAMLIATAVTGQMGSLTPLFTHPLMVMGGKLSYGIYLWHYPIAYAIRDEAAFAPTAAITLMLSIAAAWGSYVTIEAWSRRLKSSPAQVTP